MTVQELCNLAKAKQIKLEDLEIEDILKFGQIGFINPMLCEYFDLSLDEVKKIRKIKGVKNSELEDFIRDMIVLYNYIKTKHPHFPVKGYKDFVNALASNSIKFSGHREFYEKEVNKIGYDKIKKRNRINERSL